MTEMNAAIGPRPRLEWVKVDLIDVDHNYQREIKPQLVDRILRKFSWDRFGALILTPTKAGRFNCPDGQHRLKAAKLHPAIDEVPAVIMNGTGLVEEATVFLGVNRDRQAVTTVERYWAGLAAGDAMCLRVAEVLDKAGCDIVAGQGDYAPRRTSAVSAVQRSLERYGDKAAVSALKCIVLAYPADPKALRGTLISALSRLFRNNEDIDAGRLAGVLSRQSFAALTAAAEGFRKLSGGSAETAIAKAVTEIYNKGLSKNAIHFGAAG